MTFRLKVNDLRLLTFANDHGNLFGHIVEPIWIIGGECTRMRIRNDLVHQSLVTLLKSNPYS